MPKCPRSGKALTWKTRNPPRIDDDRNPKRLSDATVKIMALMLKQQPPKAEKL